MTYAVRSTSGRLLCRCKTPEAYVRQMQTAAQVSGGYRQDQHAEEYDTRVRSLPFVIRTRSGRLIRGFATMVEAEEYAERMKRPNTRLVRHRERPGY